MYARSTDSSRQLFTLQQQQTQQSTINNTQSTIHNPQTNAIHKQKMGRARPKPKAKPKAASSAVRPPAATRKRAQVPNEHEPDKCKALKGDLDEEEQGSDVLKGDLKEEDKPDEVVDGEVVKEEDDGAAEAVKWGEGVAVTDDSEYRQPIGLIDVTYTLVFTINYCISTFYFCGTHFFVERVYPYNPFIFVERVYLWNVLFCGTVSSPLVFVERLFCGTSLFVECCKVTTATQEVENIDEVDKEKVEEESKLALVEVQVVTEITAREEVGFNEKKWWQRGFVCGGGTSECFPLAIEASGDRCNKKEFEVVRAKWACNNQKKVKLEAQKIAGKRGGTIWSKWRLLFRRINKGRMNNQILQWKLQKRRKQQTMMDYQLSPSSILPRLKAQKVAVRVPSVQTRAKTKIPVSVYLFYIIISAHVHESHINIICLNMCV
jgi:hypothetical protein